jgi:pyroglutamyl-peptidase
VRILLTGFLGFGAFQTNPSAALAQHSGRPHRLLEVSFHAVDRFIDRLDGDVDVLLMLGVSAHVTTLRVERLAHNRIGDSPDVRGVVRGPAAIEPGGRDALESTLWTPAIRQSFQGDGMQLSDDAGAYLCNYAYYRALRRVPPDVRVGFVHVPPVHVLPMEQQCSSLRRLLQVVESAWGISG